MPDLSPKSTNTILDPDERSNSAPKKFRCDPSTAYPDDAPINRRNNNATAPFLSRRSSPPVTSHLDQLHVALRAQTTNCGSQNPGAPVAVYSRDRDHAEIDAKIDAVDDRSGLQQRQSTGNRDGRVPPLHGTFEDATDFVDGRVGARGGGGGEEGGVPTAVLSTSAPSTSGQGAQLLDIHFNQHYQQPVGDPSQQRHRPSQKGQLQQQQQQQQHSRKQQQRAHNAELYGQLSATDASSRLSIQSARLGSSSVVYTQASQPASHLSAHHHHPGGLFSFSTPSEVDLVRYRQSTNNNREHHPETQHLQHGVSPRQFVADNSFNLHPAGALFGSPNPLHMHPLAGATSSSSPFFVPPGATGGFHLEPKTPPVSLPKTDEIHQFPAFGGYPSNMAVTVELPPALPSSQLRPFHNQSSDGAPHPPQRVGAATALSTERLLGAGVSGISFHSSGPSTSSDAMQATSSSQKGGGTNTSSEGEPRSSSFSHSQGSTLKYGELIVLGYNGNLPEGDKGRRRSRFVLRQRITPNGVKPSVRHNVACAQSSKIYRDKSQHSVSYTLSRNSAVVVQYDHDDEKDMFQIGRSSDQPIDFVVVDTVPGAKRAEDCVVAQSTISRFSCRILISRKPPYKAWIFAAGFDSSKNIFLGEKATKWENEFRDQGEIDGLTTNGILIMHPEGGGFSDASAPGCWREVSVGGGIYALRESRSAPQKSGLITKETNELRDGSLIDLCGATLLWRSASSLLLSPTRRHLERQVEAMNQGRPQCPVGLTTLVIPLKTQSHEAERRKGSVFDSLSARQPYAYLNCGHVHGHHEWGKGETSVDDRQCPMCRKVGPYVQLTMGSETGFYVDPECPSYCFNPCGHMASEKTVKYWANVPIPHGCHGFRAICPFCATPLAGDSGFVKLIFQTDVD